MTHVEPSPQRTPSAASGSFPNAWTLFRVEGVPVRLDRSWLLIAGVVAFQFYVAFQARVPDAGLPLLLALSAAGAVLFFASILAHELGHALTSLDRDIPVVGITLFVLGGVTESTREASSARDEFVIVGIGPFISFVLAAAFGLLFTAVQGNAALAALTGFLAWTNLLLAIFNIVPGYPLDGGRLLRSVLWWLTGKPQKATRWAARVGQAFAALLIARGLLDFIAPAGGGFNALWLVLIGVFLFRGAAASHKRAVLREHLAGRRIADVMGSIPPPLPPQWSLAEALPQVQQRPSLLWPVDDPVRGGLLLEQIDAIPSAHWETTRVEQIAHAADAVTIDLEESLDTAVTRMADSPHNMLIVVSQGRPVGLLTPSLVSGLHA